MADIIDFELWKDNKPLSEMEDPCTACRQYSFCVETCDRAAAWWDTFAKKFKKTGVIRKLGGDNG